MSYDHWKTTNPDDEFLGSVEQGGNPHDLQVQHRGRIFVIVNADYEWVAPFRTFKTEDDANDAIGEMIAADDDDKRAHRGRWWRGRE